MNKKEPNKHKCELCKKAIADKTNSHIIPSFIVCKIASSDGSGKRNHELVYSIGKIIQAYSGNEVPIEVMERNFDDLSEERINEELKKNTLAKDFVFCSSCEKALADYLESPYSQKKQTDAKVAYFFWMSVIWRANHFGLSNSCMPKFMTTELRKSLDAYLQAKKNGTSTDNIQQKYPFNYRILTCKDYSKDGDGCIYAEYDKSNKIYNIVLGDNIVCFNFKCEDIPENYSFLGLEHEFIQAPLNDGNKVEKERPVSKEIFSEAYKMLLEKAKTKCLESEIEMIYRIWTGLKNQNWIAPEPIPSNIFIQHCLKLIHDEKKKAGEKYTYKNFAISFASALKDVYGIQISE